MSTKSEANPVVPELPIGSRLLAVLKVAYRARRPVLLEGMTGIGKSEIITQAARELGIDVIVLDLSLLEPPDLVGLPVIEKGRTTYACPSILPQTGCGILMLEELNRAERYIQQPALQLLTARRLHEYVLPEGWSTCAAINPEQGDYHVTPLDPAMRARFLFLRVCSDQKNWLRWARENKIHPAVLQLASSHDRLLEQVSPRSWKYVSDLLYALSPEEYRDHVLLWDVLCGFLPPFWVELLLSQDALLAVDGEIDIYDLVSVLHQRGELQKTLRHLQEEGQTDRLLTLAQGVQSIVQGPELGALHGQRKFVLEAFECFLEHLPGDSREELQHVFGNNVLSVLCFSFDFDGFLRNYRNSHVVQQLEQWQKKGSHVWLHRWLACQTALCSHLQQQPNLDALRRQNAARQALGWFLSQMNALGEDAAPLIQVMKKLQFKPISPSR